MPKKLLVDYHFHPNLSKQDTRAKARCHLIWQQFKAKRLNVVMITEHVFKNPPRAFRLLQETRPADATTLIFPGVEALTSEGVDLIVFAYDTSIYTHQKIMVPKQLTTLEMVEYIKQQPNLFGSIAHPFNIGNSGIIMRLGKTTALQAIQQLGSVEINNSCFQGSAILCDRTGMSKIFSKRRQYMEWVQTLPKEYYELPKVTLYTGGSDAHTLNEIGSGVIVPLEENATSPEVIFETIIHNHSTEYQALPREKTYLWQSIYKLYSVIAEMNIKAFRLYEGKIYQHDDQFSNFYSEAEKEAMLALGTHKVTLLKPLLNFLTYFHLTPTKINLVGIVTLIISAMALIYRPLLAVVSMVVYMFTAIVAGALARYQKTQTESGAIIKIAMHELSLMLIVLTAIGLDWLSGFWGSLYLLLYTVMLWLIITLNKIGQPIHLIIRSRYMMIAAIFLFTLYHINILNWLAAGFSAYMLLANLYMFLRVRYYINA